MRHHWMAGKVDKTRLSLLGTPLPLWCSCRPWDKSSHRCIWCTSQQPDSYLL